MLCHLHSGQAAGREGQRPLRTQQPAFHRPLASPAHQSGSSRPCHRRVQAIAAPPAGASLDLDPAALSLAEEEGFVMARPPPAHSNGQRYHIHTFGCQMNLADSERIAGALDAQGYSCAEDASDANILIYNTCSIRDKAEQKVYSALGRQAKRKRANMGDLKLVLAGCVASQEGAALLRRIPELDLVMGPHHANRIHQLLEQVDQGTQVVATEEIPLQEDITVPRRDSDLTAWVNVIHGCNERCTYCVVPNTRGNEQSRLPTDIRREMLGLGEAGYRE
ncbi:hypothetical protein WJX84_005515, partial [Apatococcus fuscideae]